jgi:hypothetical protein
MICKEPAMTLKIEHVDPSYVQDFEHELRRQGRAPEEFIVNATPQRLSAAQPGVVAPLVGTISIRHVSNGVERTYDTGYATNWVARFSEDLASGVFTSAERDRR